MMKETRREWLKNGAGSALALSTLSVAGCGAEETQPGAASGVQMIPLDYGRSFICHVAPENSVRFWIESRTRIIDEKTGSATDYYQCGSCKSEDTFAKKNLLKEDNYDFLPIFGDGQILIFRRHSFVGHESLKRERGVGNRHKCSRLVCLPSVQSPFVDVWCSGPNSRLRFRLS